ncbi:hypothetical protein M426DRAFT_266400 [Hypoxylon sp. CI-4A]|nr:hypothetical protein M426DRAFT_266400 [Hypoxylon sp. CI-4A]
MDQPMDASNELSSQWHSPRDILSLLLLIGGDVVQKAIVQLFGVYIQPIGRFPRLYLTPVAFSFGWVGYAFTSLASIVGDKQLAPSNPDYTSIVVNCDNGYSRINNSWLLGRILRDHELAVEANPGPEVAQLNDVKSEEISGFSERSKPVHISLRIDIFDLEGESRPSIDRVWIMGWITILVQLGIGIIPWALHGRWSIFLITGAGTLLALLTGSLRQWNLEKWPGRKLNPPARLSSSPPAGLAATNTRSNSDAEKGQAELSSATETSATLPLPRVPRSAFKKPKTKTVCLTGGNGHRHALILRASGLAWDLEALATAKSDSLPETPWCLLGLAVLWICLLISVAGTQSDTWYLLGIGGLGMLQNLYAASAPRKPECLGLAMKPYVERPTIIGIGVDEKRFWFNPDRPETSDDEEVTPDDELVRERPYLEPWKTAGVRGAIRELEKTIPKAGMALMPVYFPTAWKLERGRYRDSKEARFWRWMFKRPTKESRVVSASDKAKTSQ